MTTDPSVPRPTVPSSSVPRSQTQQVTISQPATMVGAVATVVLGVALGLANQSADNTAMGLRVPALLAALLMVGQGIVNFRKAMPRREQMEVVPDGESGTRGRELAVVRPIPARSPGTPMAVRPTPATLSVPIVVILLAAWLGLADLRVDAPQALSVLSLVSAFALFALGWGLLPARR